MDCCSPSVWMWRKPGQYLWWSRHRSLFCPWTKAETRVITSTIKRVCAYEGHAAAETHSRTQNSKYLSSLTCCGALVPSGRVYIWDGTLSVCFLSWNWVNVTENGPKSIQAGNVHKHCFSVDVNSFRPVTSECATLSPLWGVRNKPTFHAQTDVTKILFVGLNWVQNWNCE